MVKAKADGITISGFDGGTGASPRSSMRHAGIPWELGLAEVQQTLLLNKLRDRVRIEVDGKILTGRDVAIAAMFGAELFAFGTGPLIASSHCPGLPYAAGVQPEHLPLRHLYPE